MIHCISSTEGLLQHLVAVTDGVRQLETFYAVGKSRHASANTTNITVNAYDFAVSNVIEGLWDTEPRKCFISAAKRGGVATIDIPWSMVTHVELLNGRDKGNSYLTSTNDENEHLILFKKPRFWLEVTHQ